jgi:hypothetical protein
MGEKRQTFAEFLRENQGSGGLSVPSDPITDPYRGSDPSGSGDSRTPLLPQRPKAIIALTTDLETAPDKYNPPPLTPETLRLLRTKLMAFTQTPDLNVSQESKKKEIYKEATTFKWCSDGWFFIWAFLIVFSLSIILATLIIFKGDIFFRTLDTFDPNTDIRIRVSSCVVSIRADPNISRTTLVIDSLSLGDDVGFNPDFTTTYNNNTRFYDFHSLSKACRIEVVTPASKTLNSVIIFCRDNCLVFQSTETPITVNRLMLRAVRGIHSLGNVTGNVTISKSPFIVNMDRHKIFRKVWLLSQDHLASIERAASSALLGQSQPGQSFKVVEGDPPAWASIDDLPDQLWTAPLPDLFTTTNGQNTPLAINITTIKNMEDQLDEIFRKIWSIWRMCNVYSGWEHSRSKKYCLELPSPDFIAAFNGTATAEHIEKYGVDFARNFTQFFPEISISGPLAAAMFYRYTNIVSIVVSWTSYLIMWYVVFLYNQRATREERRAVSRLLHLHQELSKAQIENMPDQGTYLNGRTDPSHRRFWFLPTPFGAFDCATRNICMRLFRLFTNYRRFCTRVFKNLPPREEYPAFWKEFKFNFRVLFYSDYPRKRMEVQEELYRRVSKAERNDPWYNDLNEPYSKEVISQFRDRVTGASRKPRIKPAKLLNMISNTQPKNQAYVRPKPPPLAKDPMWQRTLQIRQPPRPIESVLTLHVIKNDLKRTLKSALVVRLYRLEYLWFFFRILLAAYIMHRAIGNLYLHSMFNWFDTYSFQKPTNTYMGWFHMISFPYSMFDCILAGVSYLLLSFLTSFLHLRYSLSNNRLIKWIYLFFLVLDLLFTEAMGFVAWTFFTFPIIVDFAVSFKVIDIAPGTDMFDILIIVGLMIVLFILVTVRWLQYEARSMSKLKEQPPTILEKLELKKKQFVYERWLSRQTAVFDVLAATVKINREKAREEKLWNEAEANAAGKDNVMVQSLFLEAKKTSKNEVSFSKPQNVFTKRSLKTMLKMGTHKDPQTLSRFLLDFLQKLMLSTGHPMRLPDSLGSVFLFLACLRENDLTTASEALVQMVVQLYQPGVLLSPCLGSITKHVFDVVFGALTEPSRSDQIIQTVILTHLPSQPATMALKFFHKLAKVHRLSLMYLLSAKKEIHVPRYMGESYIIPDVVKVFYSMGFKRPFPYSQMITNATEKMTVEGLTPAIILAEEASLAPELAKFLPQDTLNMLRSLTAMFSVPSDPREIDLLLDNNFCPAMKEQLGLQFSSAIGILNILTSHTNYYSTRVLATIVKAHWPTHQGAIAIGVRLLLNINIEKAVQDLAMVHVPSYELLTLLMCLPDDLSLAFELFVSNDSSYPRRLLPECLSLLQNGEATPHQLKEFISTKLDSRNPDESKLGWLVRKVYWLRKMLARRPLQEFEQCKIDSVVFHMCCLNNVLPFVQFRRMLKKLRVLVSLSQADMPLWRKVYHSNKVLRKYGMPTLRLSELAAATSLEGLSFPPKRILNALRFLDLNETTARIALQYCSIIRFYSNLVQKASVQKSTVSRGSLLTSLFFRSNSKRVFSLEWVHRLIQGLEGLAPLRQTLGRIINTVYVKTYVSGYLERANRDIYAVNLNNRFNSKAYLMMKTESFIVSNIRPVKPSLTAWIGLVMQLMGVIPANSFSREIDVQQLLRTEDVNPTLVAQMLDCYDTAPVERGIIIQTLITNVKQERLPKLIADKYNLLLAAVEPDFVEVLTAMILKKPVSHQLLQTVFDRPIMAKFFNFMWRLRMGFELNLDEFTAYENQDIHSIYRIKLLELAAVYELINGRITPQSIQTLIGPLPSAAMRSLRQLLFIHDRNLGIAEGSCWMVDGPANPFGPELVGMRQVFSASLLLSKGLSDRLKSCLPIMNELETLHDGTPLVDFVCDLARIKQMMTPISPEERAQRTTEIFVWTRNSESPNPFMTAFNGPLVCSPLTFYFMNPNSPWDKSTAAKFINAFLSDDMSAFTLVIIQGLRIGYFTQLKLFWEMYFACTYHRYLVELSTGVQVSSEDIEFSGQARTAAMTQFRESMLAAHAQLAPKFSQVDDPFIQAIANEMCPQSSGEPLPHLMVMASRQLITKFIEHYEKVTRESILRDLRGRLFNLPLPELLFSIENLKNLPNMNERWVRSFTDSFMDFANEEMCRAVRKLGHHDNKGPVRVKDVDKSLRCVSEVLLVDAGIFILGYLRLMTKIEANKASDREQAYSDLLNLATAIFEVVEGAMLFCDCGVFTSKFQAIQLLLLAVGIVVKREDMLAVSPQVFRPDIMRLLKGVKSGSIGSVSAQAMGSGNAHAVPGLSSFGQQERRRSVTPVVNKDRMSVFSRQTPEKMDLLGLDSARTSNKSPDKRGEPDTPGYKRKTLPPLNDFPDPIENLNNTLNQSPSITPNERRRPSLTPEPGRGRLRSLDIPTHPFSGFINRAQLFRLHKASLVPANVRPLDQKNKNVDFYEFRHRLTGKSLKEALNICRQEYQARIDVIQKREAALGRDPTTSHRSRPLNPILLEIYYESAIDGGEDPTRAISLYFPKLSVLDDLNQFNDYCFQSAESSVALTVDPFDNFSQSGFYCPDQVSSLGQGRVQKAETAA